MFDSALAEEIWASKYRFDPSGYNPDRSADTDYEATVQRVALALRR